MKKLKNNLDERQEQDLLHIESTSFWLLFCGLLAAIFIEWLMGFDTKAMAGEWILFFAASISMAVRCLRKGIWDRHLKPNLRTNLMISATAAVVFGAFVAVRTGRRFPDRPQVPGQAGGRRCISCFQRGHGLRPMLRCAVCCGSIPEKAPETAGGGDGRNRL